MSDSGLNLSDLFKQQQEQNKQQQEHREALRRDIELHVAPIIAAAMETDKAAITLGQSVLRTSTILNGGALVAIPAVVTLFGIDAKAVIESLMWAGGLFIVGLLASWLSTILGFFALSHRADRDYDRGEVTKFGLYKDYYPDQFKEHDAEHDKHQTRVLRRNRAFERLRFSAIVCSFASLAVFVGGSVVGGWSVLHAPIKATTSSAAISAPRCKDGSQNCPPWERQWGTTKPQPGSIVTPNGTIFSPPSPK
jgi:hypothetical protein